MFSIVTGYKPCDHDQEISEKPKLYCRKHHPEKVITSSD